MKNLIYINKETHTTMSDPYSSINMAFQSLKGSTIERVNINKNKVSLYVKVDNKTSARLIFDVVLDSFNVTTVRGKDNIKKAIKSASQMLKNEEDDEPHSKKIIGKKSKEKREKDE